MQKMVCHRLLLYHYNTSFLFFLSLLATLRGMWDLISLTRDQICAPRAGAAWNPSH